MDFHSFKSVPLHSPQWERMLSAITYAAVDHESICASVRAETYLSELLNAGLIGIFQANRMAEDLHQAQALRARAKPSCTSSNFTRLFHGASHPQLALRPYRKGSLGYSNRTDGD